MTHISDDDLVLMHYGEATPEGAARHLGECAGCRDRAGALAVLLDSVANDDVPDAPAEYEEKVWNTLRFELGRKPAADGAAGTLLPRPSGREGRGRPDEGAFLARRWTSHLKTAAAAAALVTFGFLAGRNQEPARPQAAAVANRVKTPPAPAPAANEPSTGAGIAYAAERHFDRSSRLLLEVANDGKSASTLEQSDAEALLASNRLYRVMAVQTGATGIADLLADIEPILIELAHTPSDASAADLAVIRQRIAERELLFKLRVVSETLRRRDADAQKTRSTPVTPVS